MVGTEFCDALILLQASFNTKAAAPACEGSCLTQYLSSRGLQSFWLSKNCSLLFSLARDSEKSSQSSRTLTYEPVSWTCLSSFAKKNKVVHHTKPMAGPAHSGCWLVFLWGIGSQLFLSAFIGEYSVFMCFQWSLTKDVLKSNYETTLNIAPPLLTGCWGGRKYCTFF